MKNIFKQVEFTKVKSNTFDLSHDRKYSMNLGNLTPILCMDVLPGDIFRIQSASILRFAPLIAPVMHQVNIYVHYFFIPNRLVWDNWEDFITGGEDGLDTTVAPYVEFPGLALPIGSVGDYMGLPAGTGLAQTMKSSPIAAAGYGLVYDEYYRDQNLQQKLDIKLQDGDNSSVSGLLSLIQNRPLPRAWQHDYFTSCLPWTQKGAEATIPLGTQAPITFTNSGNPQPAQKTDGTDAPTTTSVDVVDIGAYNTLSSSSGGQDAIIIDVSDDHFADLSSATAASIIDLRRAFKLQEWLEKNARGGSRYIESILAHFGVRSSDARLQRPEFIGGGTTRVQFSEVLQTSDNTSQNTPLATMGGHGVGAGKSKYVTYKAEEHGYILGIMSVMPKTAYQQGLPRHYTRFDKFDYYWPEFAHVGEQAVLNKEVVWGGQDPEGTFGYQMRYAEYKFQNSSVHGEFRTTLDFWHMGRIFPTAQSLNAQFIECDPTDRIFAVQSANEYLWVQTYNKVLATRKMPYFGSPKM